MLSGCGTFEHTEDYTKLYKNYFDSALGDWKVVESGSRVKTSDYFFESDEKYRTWLISYKDNEEHERFLNIDNWYHIDHHIYTHFIELFDEELEQEIGETPDYLKIRPYILTEDKVNYVENPEKFYENYKDVYHFQDFSLSTVFENNHMFVEVELLVASSSFTELAHSTKDEKVQLLHEKTNDLLKRFPKANVVLSLYWDTAEDREYLYYIQGEKVYPQGTDESKRLEAYMHMLSE